MGGGGGRAGHYHVTLHPTTRGEWRVKLTWTVLIKYIYFQHSKVFMDFLLVLADVGIEIVISEENKKYEHVECHELK